jgi:hypothetical protein
MRDKNLSQEQFNIQLEKVIAKKLAMRHFSEELSRIVPSDGSSYELGVSFLRDFRSLRALSIILWYLPEELKWEILLVLESMPLNFLNFKQILEIKIYLAGKIEMQKFLYLTERYSARELFGNILGNELEVCLKNLKIFLRTKPRAKRKIRHRGYRDKGSLRLPHCWLPSSDFLLTEEMNSIERKRYLTTKYLNYLLKYLRSI